MSSWLWLTGVPGSPGNNEWIEISSFSFGSGRGISPPVDMKSITFSAQIDASYPRIMDKLIKGELIDEAILFLPPLTEYHFYPVTITSLSVSQEVMTVSFICDKFYVKSDGSP